MTRSGLTAKDCWRAIALYGRNSATYKIALATCLISSEPESAQTEAGTIEVAPGTLAGEEAIRDLYQLLCLLPRCTWDTPRVDLPLNGIYFFFEHGQSVQLDGEMTDRIVRVGTHNRAGNFRGRIRQHYGMVNSLGGNKNGSVFRRHVGGALLRKDNIDDPGLPEWLRQMGLSDPEVEVRVCERLRHDFTFSCVRVDDSNERLSLEGGIIALLARYPIQVPSPSWLGRHAANPKIQRSGLWNTQRIDAEPLTDADFHRLEEIVSATLAEP